MRNQQEMRRTLDTKDLAIFGLSNLTPMVVLAILGVIAQASNGAALTAHGGNAFYRQQLRANGPALPRVGFCLRLRQKGLNPKVGFMAGWTVLLDY